MWGAVNLLATAGAGDAKADLRGGDCAGAKLFATVRVCTLDDLAAAATEEAQKPLQTIPADGARPAWDHVFEVSAAAQPTLIRVEVFNKVRIFSKNQ